MAADANIDHGSRKHALLSASGASRWINCTPSPRMEEQFENKGSAYADEGTLAHEFAELNLKRQLGFITKRKYDSLVKPFLASHHYTDEMEPEVQKHVDYVIQQYTEAKRLTKDARLLIEEKVDLTVFIEDGFGTCDDIIISDGVLEVIDLKYGKGLRVSAMDNSQLKLYGLGALMANEILFDIHTIRLTIVQPRLDSISSWEISAEDLIAWGENVVKPKAEQAYAGEGEQVPGDWCRFCRAKARCRALSDQNLELARHDFADPNLLTDGELVEAQKLASQISDWLTGVSQYMYSEAMNGKKWDGLKLVKANSNRKWSDEKAVEDILLDNLYAKEDITSSKILGIGAIEKLLGKNLFAELLYPVVIKPEGKPVLVDESDKRPEYDPSDASSDFGDDIEDIL